MEQIAALSLTIPPPQICTNTPDGSPRALGLPKSFSERRFVSSSPRSSPGPSSPASWKGSSQSSVPLGPTGAGTPNNRVMLHRFHTSSPRALGLRSPMSGMRSGLGAGWTRAIVDLYQAQDPDEMMRCLVDIQALLRVQKLGNGGHAGGTKEQQHAKFCKKDLEAALNEKKKKLPLLFTPDVRRFSLELLAEFFDKDRLNKLPSALLIYTTSFLSTSQLGVAASVCQQWKEVVGSDAVWKPLYVKRFHFLDAPKTMATAGAGAAPAAGSSRPLPFQQQFRARLLDPFVGDLVEVAWKGKFRLESLDIYQGLAWWSAVVVEKGENGARYKIHYPGWDSRWDEWVPRDRLRWTIEQDLHKKIGPNDDVEIWCCGSNVPGAWLEAKVRKVKGQKYCVGRVLSSGALWVDRERVRMSPKGAARSLGKQGAASFFSRDAAAAAAAVGANCSIM